MTNLKKKELTQEKRKALRRPFTTAVAYATRGFSSIEYIEDISAWGVFIRTPEKIPVGEDITMTIPQPDNESSIKIIGEVVRTSPKGIGVKFKMGIDDSAIKPMSKESLNKQDFK